MGCISPVSRIEEARPQVFLFDRRARLVFVCAIDASGTRTTRVSLAIARTGSASGFASICAEGCSGCGLVVVALDSGEVASGSHRNRFAHQAAQPLPRRGFVFRGIDESSMTSWFERSAYQAKCRLSDQPGRAEIWREKCCFDSIHA